MHQLAAPLKWIIKFLQAFTTQHKQQKLVKENIAKRSKHLKEIEQIERGELQ